MAILIGGGGSSGSGGGSQVEINGSSPVASPVNFVDGTYVKQSVVSSNVTADLVHPLVIQSVNNSEVPLTVKGNGSTSIQVWQDSGGSQVGVIDPYGTFVFNNVYVTSKLIISNAHIDLAQGYIIVNPLNLSVSAGTAIDIYRGLVNLSSSANITFTSTPTIQIGTNGQMLRLRNAGTHNIILQDGANLANSAIRNSGRTNLTLLPGNVVDYQYFDDVAAWQQVSAVV